MAASLEFFSRFRQFGSTLDRDCNELKAKLEDKDTATDSEGRCHLVLREILSEVTELKEEINTNNKGAKQSAASFAVFLDTCERLARHTKDHLDELESHLVKYGYKKSGDLTSVDAIYEEHDDHQNNENSPSADHAESANSEEENTDVSMETDNIGTNPDMPSPSKKAKLDEDEVDPLKSPVRPDTYIPMIQFTPHLDQTAAPCTPVDSPLPPQTTTPLLRRKTKRAITNEPSTPDNNTPELPNTFTPMIKLGGARSHVLKEDDDDASPPQLPAPPVFSTPGLKLKGRHQVPCQSFASPAFQIEEFGTPTPPDVTSVILMRPEEIKSPIPSSNTVDDCTMAAPQANTSCSILGHEWIIKPIDDAEHETLPSYIKNQFSTGHINDLLMQISGYLTQQQDHSGTLKLSEEELQNMFALGRKTKAFMLVLMRLGRAKVSGDQVIFVY